MIRRSRCPWRADWLAGVALAAAIASVSALAAEPASVGEQYKCPTCHIDRLKEYRSQQADVLLPDEPTPLEPTGRQDVASTPAMCLSCHDGFVKDSRILWREGHRAHPLGIEPGAGIAAPQVAGEPAFPLNPDGKVYCGSCHTAHAGEDELVGAPTFMRMDPANGQICQGCHQRLHTVLDTSHDLSLGADRAGGPRDFQPKGLCGTCHVAHGARGPLLWARTPAAGNTAVDGLCRTCHKIGKAPLHESDHPIAVQVWSQQLRESVRSKSTTAMPVFDAKGHAAQLGAIGCATCHEPHRADSAADVEPEAGSSDGYFLRLQDSAGFLCADCHGPRSLFLYKYFHSAQTRRR